jgi:hypothetical protein
VHKPKQFPTPFVHFTGSVILEKVNGAISLPASARLNPPGSERIIESGAKRNESLNYSVNFRS